MAVRKIRSMGWRALSLSAPRRAGMRWRSSSPLQQLSGSVLGSIDRSAHSIGLHRPGLDGQRHAHGVIGVGVQLRPGAKHVDVLSSISADTPLLSSVILRVRSLATGSTLLASSRSS